MALFPHLAVSCLWLFDLVKLLNNSFSISFVAIVLESQWSITSYDLLPFNCETFASHLTMFRWKRIIDICWYLWLLMWQFSFSVFLLIENNHRLFLSIKFFLIFKPKLKPSTSAECVKVVVRCRPLDEKEIRDGHERYCYY